MINTLSIFFFYDGKVGYRESGGSSILIMIASF
jgi:hypothetical protein